VIINQTQCSLFLQWFGLEIEAKNAWSIQWCRSVTYKLLQEKFLVAICCKGCIVQLTDNC
jgi:hypothetical protein